MKIVVTGGSGSLGLAVITELLNHGHEVLNLDRKPHPGGFVPTWLVDLAEPGSLYEACEGAGGLVHLAAFYAPNLTTDCNTFNTNTASTYNVLKAATVMGVGRVVLISSSAAYGYIYGPPDMAPDYLPVDEDHPCRPVDAYGLSKVVGERVADSFAAAHDVGIVSLRFPGVIFDPEYRLLKERMADPGIRRSGFWAYVDARDAATSCRLALDADLSGHHVLNVAAPRSSMREPTRELIDRFYPQVTDVRAKPDDRWSPFDSSRAQRLLGFEAQYGWEGSTAG